MTTTATLHRTTPLQLAGWMRDLAARAQACNLRFVIRTRYTNGATRVSPSLDPEAAEKWLSAVVTEDAKNTPPTLAPKAHSATAVYTYAQEA